MDRKRKTLVIILIVIAISVFGTFATSLLLLN